MANPDSTTVVNKFYSEVFQKGNMKAIDELLAPDFKEHEVFPGLPPTREGVKQFLGSMKAAFPDFAFDIHDTIAQGEKVVSRYTFRGTHKGAFAGIPATGKRVEVNGIEIMRVSGGKITDHWGVTDTLTMMTQLGVVPPPGQPPKK